MIIESQHSIELNYITHFASLQSTVTSTITITLKYTVKIVRIIL